MAAQLKDRRGYFTVFWSRYLDKYMCNCASTNFI